MDSTTWCKVVGSPSPLSETLNKFGMSSTPLFEASSVLETSRRFLFEGAKKFTFASTCNSNPTWVPSSLESTVALPGNSFTGNSSFPEQGDSRRARLTGVSSVVFDKFGIGELLWEVVRSARGRNIESVVE